MPDFADLFGRRAEEAAAANERDAAAAREQPDRGGSNSFADALGERVTAAGVEQAQTAVLDARDEVARLRRESAHRDDVAYARELLAEARDEVRRLKGS